MELRREEEEVKLMRVMGYHDRPLLSYWGFDHMGSVVTLLSSCQPV